MRFANSINTVKPATTRRPQFLRRMAAFGLLGALSLGMLAPLTTRAAVSDALESAGLISIPKMAVDQNGIDSSGPTASNSPAAPVPAAAPSIVGIWTNQVNNIIFMSAFRADGTMATIWTDANTGKKLYEGVGRYTFDGKHLTYSFPPASQEADVVFTDPDHIDYHTTKSTIPGAAGIETIMTRVKDDPSKAGS